MSTTMAATYTTQVFGKDKFPTENIHQYAASSGIQSENTIVLPEPEYGNCVLTTLSGAPDTEELADLDWQMSHLVTDKTRNAVIHVSETCVNAPGAQTDYHIRTCIVVTDDEHIIFTYRCTPNDWDTGVIASEDEDEELENDWIDIEFVPVPNKLATAFQADKFDY